MDGSVKSETEMCALYLYFLFLPPLTPELTCSMLNVQCSFGRIDPASRGAYLRRGASIAVFWVSGRHLGSIDPVVEPGGRDTGLHLVSP